MAAKTTGTASASGDKVEALLRARGLRITGDRLAIWHELLTARDHMDADELYRRLRDKGLKGSRATVYRTLDLYVKAALVSKIRATEQRFVYEVAIGRKHHDHLVCVGCGKIIEFVNEQIERLQDEVAQKHGFELVAHFMRLSGLCAACRRKKADGD
jgi:Fur family ferric uptake transcriptional regulator